MVHLGVHQSRICLDTICHKFSTGVKPPAIDIKGPLVCPDDTKAFKTVENPPALDYPSVNGGQRTQ
jgi:ribosomal protein S10